jgi:hypothetical protein
MNAKYEGNVFPFRGPGDDSNASGAGAVLDWY